MSVVTLERPIDDVRYVNFMGIGGDLVEFIYPDMYRVKVFADGKLMEKEEIEVSIRSYLNEKVAVYNQYLLEQQGKAPAYYGLHSETYDFIEQADPAATPNRNYKLLPAGFFAEDL